MLTSSHRPIGVNSYANVTIDEQTFRLLLRIAARLDRLGCADTRPPILGVFADVIDEFVGVPPRHSSTASYLVHINDAASDRDKIL